MRAMFRLTGSPLVDIFLIFVWWPYAAMVWVVVTLFELIARAVRPGPGPNPWLLPAGEEHRRAAVDIGTRRRIAQGMPTPELLDSVHELQARAGSARTRGELAHLVGVPVEALGPLPVPAHVRRRRVLIVSAAVLAVLCAGCGAVAVITAPPQPTSWAEWCTQYRNADGTLTVGPPDIHRAVRATERLPVPANATAAYELRAAGTAAASYDPGSEQLAAAHMTNVASVMCA